MARGVALAFRVIMRVAARGTAAESDIVAKIDKTIATMAGHVTDFGGRDAGIGHREVGDVIVGANGRPIRNLSDFVAQLEAVGLGSSIDLTVVRDGRQRSVSVAVTDIGP